MSIVIEEIKRFFSAKNFMRSLLAILWSGYCMAYFWRSSFKIIPTGSEQLVNIICGVLIGTIIGGIFGYYFATSQSSTDKNDLIKTEVPPPNSSSVKTEVTVTEPVKKDGE